MNPPALGNSNYQIPFFLFVYEKEENALGVGIHTKTWGPPSAHKVLQPAAGRCGTGIPTPFFLEPLRPLPIWLRPLRKLLWDPL